MWGFQALLASCRMPHDGDNAWNPSLGGYPGVVALPDRAEGCKRGGEDARRGVSLPGERPEANRGSSNKNKIAIQKGKHKHPIDPSHGVDYLLCKLVFS